MPVPEAQLAAQNEVLAALKNLSPNYTSASMTVMLTIPGGTANPAPGRGPQNQRNRQHSIAVSGTRDKDGNVTVSGAGTNPVNQSLPTA